MLRLSLLLLALILANGITTAKPQNNLPIEAETIAMVTIATTTSIRKNNEKAPVFTTWGQICACFVILFASLYAILPFDPHPDFHARLCDWMGLLKT